jgi:glycosyltransferase involved in cell wall biosynthesis
MSHSAWRVFVDSISEQSQSPGVNSAFQEGPRVRSWLRDRQIRLRAKATGRLRENPLATELMAGALWLRSSLPLGSPEAEQEALLRAYRGARTPWLRDRVATGIRRWVGRPRDEARSDARAFEARYRDVLDDARLTSSLVLKEPLPDGEKGVLYVSFEYNWMRLLAHVDVRRLLADYFVVGASSWSPTDYGVFLRFAGLSEDPLFIGISHDADMAAYRTFSPIVEPLPILASDWVDPDLYTPEPARDREIDILMVANFLRFKRHWLLFDALRRMRRDLRVMLIGIPQPGRTKQDLLEEARAFGARQDFEIATDIPIELVARHQCNAKISVILSRREGSCVAVAESLFADTPVAMSRQAHIGSRRYINARTGMLIDERHVANGLSELLERREEYRPREWAVENISARQTSVRLNDALRDYSRRTGRPWTTDITPMCWRHSPEYLRDADERRMQGAVDRLQRDHGIVFRKYEHHHVKR